MDSRPSPHVAASASVRPFTVLTASELSKLPSTSTSWLIDGLLPLVGTSIIGAPPKCGKSSLSRQIVASIAEGWPVLGREVKKGQALYLSTQEPADKIQDHFRALGCLDSPNLRVVEARGIDCRTALARLEATIRDIEGLCLVVIDMIADVVQMNDSSDYAEMQRAFASLGQLAAKHRLHLACTHHSKKAQTDNPALSFIGSSAIAGSFDQLLCLHTDARQQRSIVTAQRYGESLPVTLLNWDGERRAMHLGDSAEQVRERQKRETKDRIIIEMIQWIKANPGHSRPVILDAIRGDATAKRLAFNELELEGQIIRSGSGQKGDPNTFALSEFTGATAADAA